MKNIVKHNYWTPTPKKWRAIGDGLLSAGTAVTGWAIIEEYKFIAITALILTVVGKFLTNFFKDEYFTEEEA
jgi:hypothetical protein